MKSAVGTYSSNYARKAVMNCKAAGIPISIATAQPPETLFSLNQMRFLEYLGFETEYDYFFARRNLNFDRFGSLKGYMFQYFIDRSFNPEKILFFDDLQSNINLANALGIKTQKVSRNQMEDDKIGITQQDFIEGMAKVNWEPELVIFDIDGTLTQGNNINYSILIDDNLENYIKFNLL